MHAYQYIALSERRSIVIVVMKYLHNYYVFGVCDNKLVLRLAVLFCLTKALGMCDEKDAIVLFSLKDYLVNILERKSEMRI